MPRLEIMRHMGTADVEAVSELLAVASEADHHQALGDHEWLDLVQGGREGFAGLVAWETGHDHPVGYAQVARGQAGGESWAVELVVDPHHRGYDHEIGRTLLAAAVDLVATEGGGHVHLWVPRPTPVHDTIAAAVGLRRGRDILQLRRRLPLAQTTDLAVRPFVPGQDDAAWLDVNNRAFRRHPEQGGWSLDTLARRQDQPWFDAAGLLLHERDGRLAGFCWTKRHDHALGEIYVIAVDPDFQGLGLGRALALAGLGWLAEQGAAEGMLYVDHDNGPARRLYESLGFAIDHLDRAYVGDVAPRTA